jgi:hypothetical protein
MDNATAGRLIPYCHPGPQIEDVESVGEDTDNESISTFAPESDTKVFYIENSGSEIVMNRHILCIYAAKFVSDTTAQPQWCMGVLVLGGVGIGWSRVTP